MQSWYAVVKGVLRERPPRFIRISLHSPLLMWSVSMVRASCATQNAISVPCVQTGSSWVTEWCLWSNPAQHPLFYFACFFFQLLLSMPRTPSWFTREHQGGCLWKGPSHTPVYNLAGQRTVLSPLDARPPSTKYGYKQAASFPWLKGGPWSLLNKWKFHPKGSKMLNLDNRWAQLQISKERRDWVITSLYQ